MYCIITNSKDVIKCAKKKGAKVIEIKKSVIIDNRKKFKFVNVKPEIVESFLKKFPRIDMEEKGVKYLKYILENGLGLRNDLESLYPMLGNKFDTSYQSVGKGIMSVYASCITNIPKCYEEFFDNYECSVHWDYKHSLEFVKACQEYLEANAEVLTEEKNNGKGLVPTTVEAFLKRFGKVNENTLGYHCIKYILENDLPCNTNYDTEIYPVLAKKFDRKTDAIKRALTCAINKCRKYMPREYEDLFIKYDEYKHGKDIEGRNFLFLRLCQLYIEKHEIA